MKNLLKIFDLAKNKLSNFHNQLNEIKNLKKKYKYSDLFHRLQDFKKSIQVCDETFGVGKLSILGVFNHKCDKLLLELTNDCSILLSNLFLTKKLDKYQQLFLFYHSQGDYLEVITFGYIYFIF